MSWCFRLFPMWLCTESRTTRWKLRGCCMGRSAGREVARDVGDDVRSEIKARSLTCFILPTLAKNARMGHPCVDGASENQSMGHPPTMKETKPTCILGIVAEIAICTEYIISATNSAVPTGFGCPVASSPPDLRPGLSCGALRAELAAPSGLRSASGTILLRIYTTSKSPP